MTPTDDRAVPDRVLMAAAELYPLVKTGGLGDAVGSLAAALTGLGIDVKVMLPGYGDTLERIDSGELRAVHRIPVAPGVAVEIREYRPAGLAHDVWLVNHAALFGRSGTPYGDRNGVDWPDNSLRFGTFCKAVTAIALGGARTGWTPHVVHCHDWHTGLVPALLPRSATRPATVFNIHSLAFQGLFDAAQFAALNMDPALWSIDALEFYGQWSFLKGGLVFADRLVTVSPTYAREILTPAMGCGMDGILRQRTDVLAGILNGVDYRVWSPAHDPFLETRYSPDNIGGKMAAKRALQREFGLPEDDRAFVLAHVGRLTVQKGSDVLLRVIPKVLRNGRAQLIVLGTGARDLEQAWRRAVRDFPVRLGLHIGYSEALAHRIIAGADAFVMPSRFEPCGLTQLYSLAYGTVPVVHATGGLVDTVVDVSSTTLEDGTATGFSFERLALLPDAIARAQACFERTPAIWSRMMRNGMRQNFGWEKSAAAYIDVYRRARCGPGDTCVTGEAPARHE